MTDIPVVLSVDDESLVNVPLREAEKERHIVRSVDPCMLCTVH